MKKIKAPLALLLLICLSFGNVFSLNPSRTYKKLPSDFGVTYNEVKIPTSDGAELTGWYFPAKEGKTTKMVVICHNGEGNMADHLRRVDQFSSIGMNVMIFDYRGFGTSSEFEIDNNMYLYPQFQEDIKATINYCKKNYVSKMAIYGWGIGGGMAFGVGYNRVEITHIISDDPFQSMEDLEEKFEDWDEPMEVPFAGYNKEFEPIYTLEQKPTGDKKMLIIAGSHSPISTPSDIIAMGKKAKGQKLPKGTFSVITMDNPDKKDNFKVDKSAYFKHIKDFLGGK